MALSVVMPALEMAQETGKVVSWHKKEGEHVAKGELLLEIETDKAVVEIEAQGDGILSGVSAREGDVIPVGQTIAWLLVVGETVPSEMAPAQTGRTNSGPATPGRSPTSAGRPADAAATGTARMSPKARKLAKEHGVDINALRGSGPEGEILADDILKAAASSTPPEPVAEAAAESLSAIGRLMAERTTHSWTTVPHFFVSRDVDATSLVAARERLVRAIEPSRGVKPTHTDVLVAAVARALQKHPRMNASWAHGAIRTHADVHIGLAMAVNDGVVAAVIPNADRASVANIALKRRELTERARANRLQPSDLAGATFTISNLGMYNVDAFTAIIVPPQAGILAVGAIAQRAVAVDGQVGVRPMMTLTLSSDHRVVDGARAAAFLNEVVETLEVVTKGDALWI